jgi:DNA methylase
MASGIRHGESGKPWRGIDPASRGNHWKYTIQKLDELDKAGRIHFPKKTGGVPRYKRYLDEMPGILLQDIWTDISPISSHSKERDGYPTQKPLTLLSRIITVSSNPDSIVLDPFCGCGTTIVAAHESKRRWIGIDVSPTACKLMRRKMEKISGHKVEIINLPQTIEELKQLHHFEFQNWVFEKLHGRVNLRKVGDLGIDGWVNLNTPTQIKQSEHVGREKVDLFETAIERFYGNAVKEKEGVIVGFSFTKDAFDEIARAQLHKNMRIKLITVREILNTM